MMASVAEGAALTEPASVIGVESASVNPPPLANAPSVVTALPRLGRFVVAPELPDSEPATMEPPVWSIEPAAFSATLVEPAMLPALWVMPPLVVASATVGAVMLPEAFIGPALPIVMRAVSVTGPPIVSAWPSFSVNPPVLEKLPSVVTALPALGRLVVAPDEPESAPALSAPLLWSIEPAAVRTTLVEPAMLPPVCRMSPTTGCWRPTSPELAVRRTVGAVMLPVTVSGPRLVSAIVLPSASGPATVSGSASIRLKPAPVAKSPSVPTRLLGWPNVAAPAEPVSREVPIAPPAASVIVPVVTRSTVVPNTAPVSTRFPVSASANSPPVAPNPARVPIAFAGDMSETEAPLPESVPVTIVPPGSVIAPVAVRLTSGALSKLLMTSGPATFRVIPGGSITGPETVRPSASTSVNPAVEVNPARAVIEFVAAKLAEVPAAPSSVPTVSTVPGASVIELPLSTSSTVTPERLTLLPMVSGPAVAEPSTKVLAANGSAPALPVNANGALALNGASRIVPDGALSTPPAPIV